MIMDELVDVVKAGMYKMDTIDDFKGLTVECRLDSGNYKIQIIKE